MVVRRHFSRGATSTFCWSFSGCWRCSANGRSQIAFLFLHRNENSPWKHALHSHLFWNRFQVELYTSLPRRCTFCHLLQLAELAHKCRYHCELHTNGSEMDLNYISNYVCGSHLSVLVEQNSLLKSFVWIISTIRLSEMLLLSINCLISIFARTYKSKF